MASLKKKSITRYLNADGKQVRKSALAARKVTTQSRKWYGQYTDEKGISCLVPLSTDKSASQIMLNDILTKVRRRQAEAYEPFEEHEERLLVDHVADYEKFLVGKGDNCSFATAFGLD